MMNEFDIVIIGGGPAGYVSASYATQFGKKVAIIEKNRLGGCCLNYGCIPTKMMMEAALRLKQIADSKSLGISSWADFSWEDFREHSEKVRDDLRQGIAHLLKSRKCEFISGEAVIENEHAVRVEERLITATYIIIATGTDPVIPGTFDNVEKLLTTNTLWSMEHLPETITIVGAGIAGFEIASALSRLGTKVTLVEQNKQLLPTFDSDGRDLLCDELRKAGIDIITGVKIESIESSENRISVIVGDRSIQSEAVLWAAGRKPARLQTKELQLAYTERGFIAVNGNYQTNLSNIYCIGDANGVSMLAYSAMSQAMRVIKHICIGADIDQTPEIPLALFTYPSIARIGKSEQECELTNVAIGKIPYSALGFSHVINEKTGYFKVIRDINSDELVGAEICGYNSYEMIHTLIPYINRKIETDMFEESIFVHPSLSEGIKLAVEASYIRSPQV